jgi:hypothetical protein
MPPVWQGRVAIMVRRAFGNDGQRNRQDDVLAVMGARRRGTPNRAVGPNQRGRHDPLGALGQQPMRAARSAPQAAARDPRCVGVFRVHTVRTATHASRDRVGPLAQSDRSVPISRDLARISDWTARHDLSSSPVARRRSLTETERYCSRSRGRTHPRRLQTRRIRRVNVGAHL